MNLQQRTSRGPGGGDASARRRRSWWRPFLLGLVVSLPLHALVVIILAGWHRPTGSIGQGEAPREITVALAPTRREAQDAPSASPEQQSPAVDAPALQPAPSPGLAEAGGAQDVRPAGLLAGTGGGGGASGVDVTFFGAGGKGRRIAFAVDCSGSMLTGGRLRAAQEELVRAVSDLPDYVSVCVTFFNDGCVSPPPPPAPGVVDVRGYAKVRAGMLAALRHWMQDVPARGGTRPSKAMGYIFDQGDPPDIVFLLSDGEIAEEEVESILALNRRHGPAPIHCISFGDGGAAGFPLFRRIAQSTGGTFTEVRPDPRRALDRSPLSGGGGRP